MHVVILAGGSGTRFWPLSLRSRPKQLLALEGERSLLQQTFDRLRPLVPAESIWVCTTQALAEAVRGQLPEVPTDQVLEEPAGRNTAAAIGWSVASIPDPEALVAVLPADHRVADPESFRATLAAGAEAVARRDLVLTLGVRPHRPETGYGYLELGEALEDGDEDGAGGISPLHRVSRFREKPDLATARTFVESGKYLWNAGIFVFRRNTLLRLLAEHQPEIARGLDEIAGAPERLGEIYPRLPAVSIDFGLMEKIDDIGTLPLDCGWSDLGSWEALAEVLAEASPETANLERGEVVTVDARNNLLFADEGMITVVGVENLVVVRTGETVLVLPKDRAQDVKAVVEALKQRGREDLL